MSELGRGFVHACLERFDYDPEMTINALLEDNLPAELVSIDKKANTWAEPSSTELPAYSGGDALFEDEVDPELLKIKSIHRVSSNSNVVLVLMNIVRAQTPVRNGIYGAKCHAGSKFEN